MSSSKMTKPTHPTDIKFSLDLQKASLLHLDFLIQVSKFPALEEGPILTQAIHRYINLWLPLAAKHDQEILPAPLDIQWAWHCHRLCPVKYKEDCMALVGKVVDSKLFTSKELKKKYPITQKYWSEAYPNHPLEVGTDAVDPRYTTLPQTLYNIVEAVDRQKRFNYQVSLPHYRDKVFLKNILIRYQKFLFLRLKNPEIFLVPCYDTDLIWHTHQLHPLNYEHDTTELFGRVFNHGDPSEGSSVDLETRTVWEETFKESFSINGAMYRGDPPRGKLFRMTQQDTFNVCTKMSEIILESIELSNTPSDVKNFKLKISVAVNSREIQTVLSLKGPNTSWNGLTKFIFDTKQLNNLKIRLYEKSGFLCVGSNLSLGESIYDMLPHIETTEPTISRLNIAVPLGTSIGLNIVGTVQIPKLGPCKLQLVPGGYEQCVMPVDVESMWGPVPLPKLSPGIDNVCDVASHTLTNHLDQPVFTARIIHSLPLMMSVVHVMFKETLSVVAHLVGSDQLPLPSLVSASNTNITLDPGSGERALLIKNHHGDWGFVVGKWTGFKKGVPGINGTRHSRGARGVPGSTGHLSVKFSRVSNMNWHEVHVNETSDYNYILGGLKVDMKNGGILYQPGYDDIAEHIAVTFSIALLHVLCQPRPKTWKPGQRMPVTFIRGTKPVSQCPSENMAFIMAAGFMMSTPSNHYISTT